MTGPLCDWMLCCYEEMVIRSADFFGPYFFWAPIGFTLDVIALDTNNTVTKVSASNVAIASSSQALMFSANRPSLVEPNSQVDNEAPSEDFGPNCLASGMDITRRRGWLLALGLVRRNNRCFFLEKYKR